MRPRWPEESRLRLVDESIDLRCHEQLHSTAVDCAWHSVHVYERDDPGTQAPPTTMVLLLPLSEHRDVEIRVNGRTLELDEDAVSQSIIVSDSLVSSIEIADDGRSTTVALDVSLSGTWPLPVPSYYECCGLPTEDRRHVLLARGSKFLMHSFDPEYFDATPTPAGLLSIRVESVLPVRFKLRALTEPRGPVFDYHGPPWLVDLREERRARQRKRQHRRSQAHEPPRRKGLTTTASFDSNAPIQIAIIRKRSVPGGVFVGVGGALLDVDYALRGRIGAEFAAPRRFGSGRYGLTGTLFHSLALETDFRRNVTVVPAIELTHASRRIKEPKTRWWLPSVGAGTGAPLQFSNEVRPGLRGLASLNWPFIGFVTTFDWYPTFAADQTPRMQLGLLGELRF